MPGKTKDITLTTEDKVTIAATYYEAVSEKAVILLHMYGMTRQSWKEFAVFLQEKEYQAIAIDLRGHGQSLEKNKQKISYINFHDQDFRDMTKDVKAAKKFLQQQGASDISIVGASIGANLALMMAAHDREITKVVALSPGLNYKGILTEPLMSNEISNKVLLVSSTGDVDSYGAVKLLKEKYQNSELMIFAGEGHGTDILKNYKDSTDKVVNWLKGKLI